MKSYELSGNERSELLSVLTELTDELRHEHYNGRTCVKCGSSLGKRHTPDCLIGRAERICSVLRHLSIYRPLDSADEITRAFIMAAAKLAGEPKISRDGAAVANDLLRMVRIADRHPWSGFKLSELIDEHGKLGGE